MKVGRPMFLFFWSFNLRFFRVVSHNFGNFVPKLLSAYHPVSLTSLFPVVLCMILLHPPYKVKIAV